jgi:hypothetical protein
MVIGTIRFGARTLNMIHNVLIHIYRGAVKNFFRVQRNAVPAGASLGKPDRPPGEIIQRSGVSMPYIQRETGFAGYYV